MVPLAKKLDIDTDSLSKDYGIRDDTTLKFIKAIATAVGTLQESLQKSDSESVLALVRNVHIATKERDILAGKVAELEKQTAELRRDLLSANSTVDNLTAEREKYKNETVAKIKEYVSKM